jgi:peptidyl-prolyl cis-trans isomerase B (cyclophilin B)
MTRIMRTPETLRRLAAALAAWAACGLAACGEEPAPAPEPPSPEELVSEGPHDAAVLALEDLGEIRIELLRELAPDTVENFVKLAESGFYDGTSFHRVIPGFMIQGGDPLTTNHDPRDDGRGGPGYTIRDEFSAYPHVRGTVSMAHMGQRDTAGSQFFIVHERAPHLDGNYTVFGRVVDGLDVVDAVTQLEIDQYGRFGPRDRPYPEEARILSVRIERADPVLGRVTAAQPGP